MEVTKEGEIHRDALGGVLASDLLDRLLGVGTDLMAMQAEERAALHFKQQFVGLKASEGDAVGALKAPLEDLVDHQVVAVGGQGIAPAELFIHPTFIAGDAIDLQVEVGAQIQKECPQDVRRQERGLGSVGGVTEQFVEAPITVEKIPQARHDHLARSVALAELFDAGRELGEALGGHAEVVAIGGQFHPFVEVQITQLNDQNGIAIVGDLAQADAL